MLECRSAKHFTSLQIYCDFLCGALFKAEPRITLKQSLTIKTIPDSLKVAPVSIGEEEVQGVHHGAMNVKVGINIVVFIVGAH